MLSIYWQEMSYVLGEVAYSVDDSVVNNRTFSDAKTLRAAGFEQHFVCENATTVLDLAKRATAPLAHRLDEMDAMIYATCLPHNGNLGNTAGFVENGDVKCHMDFPASRLQAALEKPNCQIIGLNQQACTGVLGAVRLARALLTTEHHLRKILCVTADRFPQGARYEQSYNLISDGGAAILVGREPTGFEILGSHQITVGGLAAANDDESVGSWFSYTHRLIHETLGRCGRSLADIDWLVAQNMNPSAWHVLSSLLPLAKERIVLDSIREVGHVISGDNVINLTHLLNRDAVTPGQYVLLVMTGYGMNWQALLLRRVRT